MAGSNSVSPLKFNDPQAAENTMSALKAAPTSYWPEFTLSTDFLRHLLAQMAQWANRDAASMPPNQIEALVQGWPARAGAHNCVPGKPMAPSIFV